MELNSGNFQTEITRSAVPVLIDFWAAWCGPCKMMLPVVEAVAEIMGDQIKVGKVNVDENQDLAQQYNILSIPTLMIFKSGQVVDQFSGVLTKEALQKKVEKHL